MDKETQETFEIGDQVIWKKKDDEMLPLERRSLDEFGSGPFNILEITPVPIDQCAKNDSPNDSNRKQNVLRNKKSCPQTVREAVGHHQWIHVSCKGKSRKHSFRKNHVFSGALFKKI